MTPPIPPFGWRVMPLDLHEGGIGIQLMDGHGRSVANNQTFYPQKLELSDALFIATAANYMLGQSQWHDAKVLPPMSVNEDLGDWCTESQPVLIRLINDTVHVAVLRQYLEDNQPDGEAFWLAGDWNYSLDVVAAWTHIPK